MNKRKQEIERRKIVNLIRSSNRSGSHSNCFRVYISESENHIRKKFEAWLILRKKGYEVYTEIILNSGVRPDILAIKDGKGWLVEILESETKDEVNTKLKSYPDTLQCIIIKDFHQIDKYLEEL